MSKNDVKKSQEPVRKIGADRLGAEDRGQVASEANSGVFDDHPRHDRRGNPIAVKPQPQPKESPAATADRSVPLTVQTRHYQPGLPGIVGQILDIEITLKRLGCERLDDESRTLWYQGLKDHAMPLALVEIAIERQTDIDATGKTKSRNRKTWNARQSHRKWIDKVAIQVENTRFGRGASRSATRGRWRRKTRFGKKCGQVEVTGGIHRKRGPRKVGCQEFRANRPTGRRIDGLAVAIDGPNTRLAVDDHSRLVGTIHRDPCHIAESGKGRLPSPRRREAMNHAVSGVGHEPSTCAVERDRVRLPRLCQFR